MTFIIALIIAKSITFFQELNIGLKFYTSVNSSLTEL